ncbi:hypothetical protein [Amycolatopsis jiangsuensis]|uniref:Uncharacterized protein n=1 Tax=Amycolatopsis jiangsuensis TaxID=1181879 RepID=A0A840ILQ5_9PSEU|nr:hypothetical protein [Amycolatopsis jiangsuensis]MBB4682910.1 hypothetical protein [Amycolatopsis jiangsuensis]
MRTFVKSTLEWVLVAGVTVTVLRADHAVVLALSDAAGNTSSPDLMSDVLNAPVGDPDVQPAGKCSGLSEVHHLHLAPLLESLSPVRDRHPAL